MQTPVSTARATRAVAKRSFAREQRTPRRTRRTTRAVRARRPEAHPRFTYESPHAAPVPVPWGRTMPLKTRIEDDARVYAVGLRGEFVRHEVPEPPVIQLHESREVVIAECGCLAFPRFGTPAQHYERCPVCPLGPDGSLHR